MRRIINEMKLRLPAISVNEAVARSVISAFSAELNPTVEELGDLRCAVSEAVTDAYASHRNCLYIISTHIVEVGPALAEKCGNVLRGNYSLSPCFTVLFATSAGAELQPSLRLRGTSRPAEGTALGLDAPVSPG